MADLRSGGPKSPLLPEILRQPAPASEIADIEPIFARSASAVTPSKKVKLTLIGSLLRAFQ